MQWGITQLRDPDTVAGSLAMLEQFEEEILHPLHLLPTGLSSGPRKSLLYKELRSTSMELLSTGLTSPPFGKTEVGQVLSPHAAL